MHVIAVTGVVPLVVVPTVECTAPPKYDGIVAGALGVVAGCLPEEVGGVVVVLLYKEVMELLFAL